MVITKCEDVTKVSVKYSVSEENPVFGQVSHWEEEGDWGGVGWVLIPGWVLINFFCL